MTSTFDKTKYLNISNATESADTIGKLRLQILEKGHTLKSDCQILLVATIQHWVAHGSGLPGKDGSQGAIALAFETIKTAMGNSMGQAAIQWVASCTTGLYWNEKTKLFLTDRSEGAKRSIKEHVQNVKIGMEKGSPIYFSGNPLELFFGMLQKEIAQKPMDLEKQVTNLINRAKQESNIPESAIALIEGIQNQLHIALTEYALEMAKKRGEAINQEKQETEKTIEASEKRETEKTIEASDEEYQMKFYGYKLDENGNKIEPVKAERPKQSRKIKSMEKLAELIK